jgi:hypothetical protein
VKEKSIHKDAPCANAASTSAYAILTFLSLPLALLTASVMFVEPANFMSLFAALFRAGFVKKKKIHDIVYRYFCR